MQHIIDESKKILANLQGADPTRLTAAQKPLYDQFVRKWLPALQWRQHYYATAGAQDPNALVNISYINGILTDPEVVRIIDSTPVIQSPKQKQAPTPSPSSPVSKPISNVASLAATFNKLADLKLRKKAQEAGGTNEWNNIVSLKDLLKQIGVLANVLGKKDITDTANDLAQTIYEANQLPKEQFGSALALGLQNAEKLANQLVQAGQSPQAVDTDKRLSEQAVKVEPLIQAIRLMPDVATAIKNKNVGEAATQAPKQNTQSDDQIAQNIIDASKKLVQYLQNSRQSQDPKRKQSQDKWNKTYLPALQWRKKFYEGNGRQNPKAAQFLQQINELINSSGTY